MDHSSTENYERGVALMLLYAFAMALLSLFSKVVLTVDGLLIFLFSRYFLTLLALLPYLVWIGAFKEIHFGRHLLPQVYRALIVMLSMNLFFYCLINTSLFDSTLLYNTGPIFIPILAKLFFKSEVDKKVWWSISLSFLGLILIFNPDSGIFSPYSIAGLLAGLSMAFSSILYSRAASQSSGRISLGVFYFLFLSTVFSGLMLLAYNGLYKKDLIPILDEFLSMNWKGWAAMGATVICLIVNQTARGYAFRFAPIQKLAPFMYTIIIFSGLFDWFIFHNAPTVWSLTGGFLVVGGVFLELYFQKTIKT